MNTGGPDGIGSDQTVFSEAELTSLACVPEPDSLILLALGAGPLLRRPKRVVT